MPNALRVLLWSVLSLGMLFLAIMAFWVFLIIIGIVILARILYLKLFRKGKGTVTIHTYRMNYPPSEQPAQPGNGSQDQTYTTVIDADDLDKEYKIPRIK